MNYKIVLSYIGDNYSGFQIQENAVTVQAKLEEAIEKLFNKSVSVVASGRTDEGVHALGQVVSFNIDTNIKNEKIVSGLNFFLPQDIRILSCEEANNNFSARKSAKRKSYIYYFYLGKENPFLEKRALRVKSINIKTLKKAAKAFNGTHDFMAFRATGSSAKTTKRTVYKSSIKRLQLFGSRVLRLTICANGFLYKMVRIIVGTLLKAASGKMDIKEIKDLLQNPREWAQKTAAPPYGLYLYSVEY